MKARERLNELFRELFQLDVADLDFGIYRLLQLKRDEVEAFLTRDLPGAVDKEFKAAAGAEQAALEQAARGSISPHAPHRSALFPMLGGVPGRTSRDLSAAAAVGSICREIDARLIRRDLPVLARAEVVDVYSLDPWTLIRWGRHHANDRRDP